MSVLCAFSFQRYACSKAKRTRYGVSSFKCGESCMEWTTVSVSEFGQHAGFDNLPGSR